MTASICGGIYARVYCILYCVYDVVDYRKTTESDRQATNPKPYSWRSNSIRWSWLVVKTVHVRYLISWWVSCNITERAKRAPNCTFVV